MRRHRRHPRPLLAALLAALAALAVAASLLGTAATAQANEEICERYGTTTIQGRYVVQNNRWGTSATQCINVAGNGFTVTRADGAVPTNGAPKSYPSVFLGCHYTTCSPGTNLPLRIDAIASAPSSISYGYVGDAVYNAAYDIWLDPTPRTDGVNRTEVMIWFHRTGPVQPIGSPVGTATVGGRTWEVWTGSNGSNDVISFLAPSSISAWSFDVKDFVDETVRRGMAGRDWYLTSVQAGFEPWENGAGLSVNSFSAAVNPGSDPSDPSDPADPADPADPTDPTDPTDPGPGGCRVGYGVNAWNTGFTAEVTVTNSGSTAVDGWQLAFTLPGGQTAGQAWNAELSGSGGAVTARNVAHNAVIAPGGTVSFGFQGTHSGSAGAPSAFALNGVPCAVS